MSQMNFPEKIRTIHLIGICGTGMGTLAAMLHESGYQVQGSDENVYPPMSTFLSSRGIPIKDGYGVENLEPPPDLVVVGNVIRRDNPEAVATLESGLNYCSMPQALYSFFLNSSQSVVAAGTHGKTTTAALLVWLLTVPVWTPAASWVDCWPISSRAIALARGPTSWLRVMSTIPLFSTRDQNSFTISQKYAY